MCTDNTAAAAANAKITPNKDESKNSNDEDSMTFVVVKKASTIYQMKFNSENPMNIQQIANTTTTHTNYKSDSSISWHTIKSRI